VSEQNARLSLAIANHSCVIENGRVAVAGTGQELLGWPEVAERLLGVGQSVGATGDQQYDRLVTGLGEIFRTLISTEWRKFRL